MMRNAVVIALATAILLQSVAAQQQPPAALVNTLIAQIAAGTWLPPPYPSNASSPQAAALTYANALYQATMQSNQLVPDVSAFGAQKFWDKSPVCTNRGGCQGFRCGVFDWPSVLYRPRKAVPSIGRLLCELGAPCAPRQHPHSDSHMNRRHRVPTLLRLPAADYHIGRTLSSGNGGGFARLDTSTPSGSAAFAMIKSLPDWGTVIPYPLVRRAAALPSGPAPAVHLLSPLRLTGASWLRCLQDMAGANVFILQQLAVATNITVSIEVVHLPDAIFFATDENVQISALMQMGYDCVVSPAVLTPEKIPYMVRRWSERDQSAHPRTSHAGCRATCPGAHSV